MTSSFALRSGSQLQAHKSVFNGRPIAAAPTPFRPARLSVRVRAEDIEKKAEQAKDKVQEKAGEVANKASGKDNAPITGGPKDRGQDTLLFASDQSLSYLTGELPADYGFDPLGLLDPEGKSSGFISPAWLQYSEVIHARWAMLGAAGCIAPEILASAGVIPQAPSEVVWFKSGVIPPAGVYKNYWLDPYSLFFVEVILMQFAEIRRWQDFRKPGSQGEQYFLGLETVLKGSGDPSYPGGQFFNLFNLGRNDMKTLKTKELKNGRLAMLAVFGYGAQAVITGEGPFKNLTDHLSNPTSNNILTNFAHPAL
ncbi:Chlorophyll a-b binding protein 8, chloroplastic [Coccomyxa viridis]|uniref:Chlorophyll a-b binding protein, chloroplastic n=1 Tax=Coccomyxa viridis TaxID=1274662 RepID=A0AAV1I7C1_9CHLO|nr:Chlorophyll a-b binding protein 8, chloroplastic [Coccomyxa viridis]